MDTDKAVVGIGGAKPTLIETNETARPWTYREIARLVGRSPSTIWRRMNGRQPITRAQAIRELRFAMVLSFRGQDKSIRRVASKLAISRSAVERDLRLARRVSRKNSCSDAFKPVIVV